MELLSVNKRFTGLLSAATFYGHLPLSDLEAPFIYHLNWEAMTSAAYWNNSTVLESPDKLSCGNSFIHMNWIATSGSLNWVTSCKCTESGVIDSIRHNSNCQHKIQITFMMPSRHKGWDYVIRTGWTHNIHTPHVLPFQSDWIKVPIWI